MMAKNKSDYEVGYCKPPKHTQFKSGRSGNASGRPKKRTTFAEDILRELARILVTTEGGMRKKMSTQQALAKTFVIKALGGSLRSLEMLLREISKITSQQDGLSALLGELRKQNELLTSGPGERGDATGHKPGPSGE